jgi:hypothetical protein
MKKTICGCGWLYLINLKLLSSRCFNSSRINRLHSINSYRINNSSVSQFLPAAASDFLQDTTVKTATAKLKILFSS